MVFIQWIWWSRKCTHPTHLHRAPEKGWSLGLALDSLPSLPLFAMLAAEALEGGRGRFTSPVPCDTWACGIPSGAGTAARRGGWTVAEGWWVQYRKSHCTVPGLLNNCLSSSCSRSSWRKQKFSWCLENMNLANLYVSIGNCNCRAIGGWRKHT